MNRHRAVGDTEAREADNPDPPRDDSYRGQMVLVGYQRERKDPPSVEKTWPWGVGCNIAWPCRPEQGSFCHNITFKSRHTLTLTLLQLQG